MNKSKNIKKFLVIGLITLVVVVFYWSIKMSRYESFQVKKAEIQNAVTVSGTLTAEKKANLSFNKVGRISYLPVKIDDKVKKGQVVASLDRSDLVAVKNKELKDYLIARWNLEQVRESNNVKGDYRRASLTDDQKRLLEQYQFTLDKNVINVEIASRAIKNASLVAPFDGIVTQSNGQVNEWTSAFSTQPLVQIVDFSTLYFKAEVAQEYAGLVKIGQKGIIELDAYPKKKFTGRVYEKEKVVKETKEGDDVVIVRIRVDHLPANIILGLKGDAQIVISRKKNLIIPKEAVIRKNGKTYVKFKNGPFYQNKRVILGTFDGKNYQVVKGLKKGDRIWFR